jgi:hypothetical protein
VALFDQEHNYPIVTIDLQTSSVGELASHSIVLNNSVAVCGADEDVDDDGIEVLDDPVGMVIFLH